MDPVKTFDVSGSIMGTDYYSGDGTQGITATCDPTAPGATITVKDGLITACTT